MKKIFVFLGNLLIFLFVNLFSFLFYERKFLKGKYFKSDYWSIYAPGWKWALKDIRARILLGVNRNIPFPVSPYVNIVGSSNIIFHVDDLDNFQGFGNYFQALGNGKISIGRGSYIAPNVGLITTNHDVHNLEMHVEPKDIIIGEKCWIGMNSVILPGVILGNNTIVGAGSVVTKNFIDGNCVIAGNPAKKIRSLT